MPTQSVLILMFEGVQSLDLTGPLEVLAGANAWRSSRGESPAYGIITAGLGSHPIRTSSGLSLTPHTDLRSPVDADVLIVPGGDGTSAPDPELIAWLRQHTASSRRVASVCTGAFLLAEAGLLSGRRATTHWAYCESLAARIPDVDVLPDPIYVRDGRIATSAGVTAGIDLALALVEEDLGRDAALAIARHLMVFLRRPGSQAQFSAQFATRLASRDHLLEVQQWIADQPDADLSVDSLARRANLSPRQFARAFTAEVGISPGRYVDRVRLEAARRRLEHTDEGVEQTAVACGFGTTETMRRAFVRALDVSPAEYRRRFRSASARSTKENHADRHLAL